MATRKAAPLDAGLIARKGEAAPAIAPTLDLARPAGEKKDIIALTVRLDKARYQRLIAYGAQFTPRKTNQDILVEALDAYLDQMAD
jgi:hypothetical protein